MEILYLLFAFTFLDGVITFTLLYKLHKMHNDVLNLRNKIHYLESSSKNHFEDIKSYYSKKDID